GPASPQDRVDDLLTSPLACSFHAVSVGQFHGLDYGPGAPSGSFAVVVAASADDLARRRAAIVERDGAAVARMVRTGKQALLIAVNPSGDTSALTLFAAAARNGGVPAALSRQAMIGNTPLLVQSTGSCRALPARRPADPAP
ncbi:MAG: hypothetical protein ABW275_00575, partial [Hansschlegelia sp.]